MPPLGETLHPHPHMTLMNESNSSFRSTVSLGVDQKHRRSVSFDENVEIWEALHVNDFTDEEYESYWFSPEECNTIVDMIEITVQLMELGQDEGTDPNVCFRGLETRTAEGNAYYDTIYVDTVASVLDEQDYQRKKGWVDVERIALVCQEQSQAGKDYARLRAQDDCFEATKHYIIR